MCFSRPARLTGHLFLPVSQFAGFRTKFGSAHCGHCFCRASAAMIVAINSGDGASVFHAATASSLDCFRGYSLQNASNAAEAGAMSSGGGNGASSISLALSGVAALAILSSRRRSCSLRAMEASFCCAIFSSIDGSAGTPGRPLGSSSVHLCSVSQVDGSGTYSVFPHCSHFFCRANAAFIIVTCSGDGASLFHALMARCLFCFLGYSR